MRRCLNKVDTGLLGIGMIGFVLMLMGYGLIRLIGMDQDYKIMGKN